MTCRRVLTRVVLTVVDLSVTQVPLKTKITLAIKTSHPVLAGAVYTRVTNTLINIRQAEFIKVATGAVTPEAVDEVDTHAAIVTRVRGTFVDVSLAVCTRKPENKSIEI